MLNKINAFNYFYFFYLFIDLFLFFGNRKAQSHKILKIIKFEFKNIYLKSRKLVFKRSLILYHIFYCLNLNLYSVK